MYYLLKNEYPHHWTAKISLWSIFWLIWWHLYLRGGFRTRLLLIWIRSPDLKTWIKVRGFGCQGAGMVAYSVPGPRLIPGRGGIDPYKLGSCDFVCMTPSVRDPDPRGPPRHCLCGRNSPGNDPVAWGAPVSRARIPCGADPGVVRWPPGVPAFCPRTRIQSLVHWKAVVRDGMRGGSQARGAAPRVRVPRQWGDATPSPLGDHPGIPTQPLNSRDQAVVTGDRRAAYSQGSGVSRSSPGVFRVNHTTIIRLDPGE